MVSLNKDMGASAEGVHRRNIAMLLGVSPGQVWNYCNSAKETVILERDISDFLIAIAEVEVHIFNDSGASWCGDGEQSEDESDNSGEHWETSRVGPFVLARFGGTVKGA